MYKISLAVASDHAGFDFKKDIIDYLNKNDYKVFDFGCYSSDSCDYADYAHPLAKAVQNKEFDFGIVFCGSGNGINMTVNKYPGIRSAICWKKELAVLARTHNNANICSIPARFINKEELYVIVDAFLNNSFEGGRHEIRINKIPIK